MSRKPSVLFVTYATASTSSLEIGVERVFSIANVLPFYNWNVHVLSPNFPHWTLENDSEVHFPSEDCTFHTIGEIEPKKPMQSPLKQSFRYNVRSKLSTLFGKNDIYDSIRLPLIDAIEKICSEHQIDVIVASIPPVSMAIAVVELAKKLSIPYIVDYATSWANNEIYFSQYHRSNVESKEYPMLLEAERILVTTRAMKEHLLQKYDFLTYEDVHIVSNGLTTIDPKVRFPKKRITIVVSRKTEHSFKTIIRYCQTFFAQKDALDCQFCFVGILSVKHQLYMAKKLKPEQAMYEETTSKEVVRSILKNSAASWVIIQDARYIPQELFWSMESNCPVVLSSTATAIASLRSLVTASAIYAIDLSREAFMKTITTLLYSEVPSFTEEEVAPITWNELGREYSRLLGLSSKM
jgi:hypothetical protein